MSLSLFLVPVTIGAVTVALGAGQVEVELTALSQNDVYFKLETKMNNEQLLQETLQNYGSSSEVENEEVTSMIGDTKIAFIKGDQGTYHAYFNEDISLRDAEEFVSNIYEEYTRIVQRKTYEKLLQRAENEGLVLEMEETNENESLVLTFEVKE